MNQYVIPETTYDAAVAIHNFPAIKIGTDYYASQEIVDDAIALGNYDGATETALTATLLQSTRLSADKSGFHSFKTYCMPQTNLNSSTPVNVLFDDNAIINDIGAVVSPDHSYITLQPGVYYTQLNYRGEGQNSSVILQFSFYLDGVEQAESAIAIIRKSGGNRAFTLPFTIKEYVITAPTIITIKSERIGKSGYANTIPDKSVLHIQKVRG